MKQRVTLPFVIVLAVIAGLMRVLPHQPNMAAMGALFLVSGMYASGLMALAIPLSVLVISDAVIGFYSPSIMASVYISYIAMIGIGMLTSRLTMQRSAATRSFTGVIGASLGSIVFFLVTNAAVWQWGKMYQHTLAGLMQSYISGLPFFRNSVTSDMAYAAVFIIAVEVMVGSKIFQTKTKHATLGSA